MDDEDMWAAAAFHEAGHCVVALALDLPVVSVTLKWQKKLFGRATPSGMVSVHESATDPNLLAGVAVAGPIAEAVWGQHRFEVPFDAAYELTVKGNPDDFAALRGYLRAGRLNRRKVVASVRGLVAAHWSAVTRVAEELQVRRILTAEQVSALVFARRARR